MLERNYLVTAHVALRSAAIAGLVNCEDPAVIGRYGLRHELTVDCSASEGSSTSDQQQCLTRILGSTALLTPLRPATLAAYNAPSALSINSLTPSKARSCATPMLTVIRFLRLKLPRSMGCRATASRNRSAMTTAASLSVSGSNSANSSPPMRPTRS